MKDVSNDQTFDHTWDRNDGNGMFSPFEWVVQVLPNVKHSVMSCTLLYCWISWLVK
jgi:hypothetical protein